MASLTPVPDTAIIVVAAGSGTRLGQGAAKAFVGIDERTILSHCLDGVFAAFVAHVIIVAPENLVGDALTEAFSRADAADRARPLRSGVRRDLVTVVAGGATRPASVSAGLAALWGGDETVLVHDAARALTPPEVFVRVADAVRASGVGALPVLPVVDTLKRRAPTGATGGVDRAELVRAQTPQGFTRGILVSAAQRAADVGEEFTDESSLVEAAGHAVATVEGDERAFKITTPADLERARALVAAELRATASVPLDSPRAPEFRVGVGTDVHAFGGEGSLWLAGLEWPGERALAGHSDGDAVAHAIVDAVLSATGLGDIGTHFGVDRPEFSGAHADAFLARTRALLTEAGWAVGNVSVQVQANRPRFAARRAEAEARLSASLGAPVSVSATTTDGLGFTGAGDGVQAFAVALVTRR